MLIASAKKRQNPLFQPFHASASQMYRQSFGYPLLVWEYFSALVCQGDEDAPDAEDCLGLASSLLGEGVRDNERLYYFEGTATYNGVTLEANLIHFDQGNSWGTIVAVYPTNQDTPAEEWEKWVQGFEAQAEKWVDEEPCDENEDED